MCVGGCRRYAEVVELVRDLFNSIRKALEVRKMYKFMQL